MVQEQEPIISEDAIRQILAEQKEVIRQRIVDSFVKESIAGLEYTIRSQVNETVRSIFAEEFNEEIRTRVVAQKEDLLAGIDKLVVRMGAEISSALVEDLAERMKQSWNRKKVVEALFG